MKKVLVVDDDRILVDSICTVLKGGGYAVCSACCGEEGFKKAKTEKPDLMLLDVMMTHDTEGFDTTQKLKRDAETKKIPIIIMTGIRKAKMLPFQFEPDEDWLPVKAVLEKPVPPDKLLAEIEKALA